MADRRSGVAFIVPYRFVPAINGGHKAAFGLAKYLHQAVPITVYSAAENDQQEAPFPVRGLFSDRPSKYVSPVVAYRFLQYFRKDHIRHCILHQHFMSLLLWPICWLLGIKGWIFVQNIEYQRFKTLKKWWWPLMYLSEWWAYKTAHQLVFISPADQAAAIPTFGLDPAKCTTVPYGTNWAQPPLDRASAKMEVCQRHAFGAEERLLLFFGPQSYLPNLQAVERIVEHINPALQELELPPYRFLICGGGLPEPYERLVAYQVQGIAYLGFVEDIEMYVKAADLMINPINTGGGVKTKVIEAIAVGTPVLSSVTGAIGVDQDACGDLLHLVSDTDYGAFAQKVAQLLAQPKAEPPDTFYQTYYWGNTIQPLVRLLKTT